MYAPLVLKWCGLRKQANDTLCFTLRLIQGRRVLTFAYSARVPRRIIIVVSLNVHVLSSKGANVSVLNTEGVGCDATSTNTVERSIQLRRRSIKKEEEEEKSKQNHVNYET